MSGKRRLADIAVLAKDSRSQGFRLGVPVLGAVKLRPVAEAKGHATMLLPQGLLADSQRPLIKRGFRYLKCYLEKEKVYPFPTKLLF